MLSRQIKRSKICNFSRGSLLFLYLLVMNSHVLPISGRVANPEKVGSPTLRNPHHFQLSCDNCHQAPVSGAKNDAIGPLNRPVNQICAQAGCHVYNEKLDHPVDVRPLGKIPADLPLDKSSRITCLTCHDEVKRDKVITDNPDFLRRSSGEDLCQSCHIRLGGTLAKRAHWQFSNQAHLGNKQDGTFSSRRNTSFIGGIDRESRTCISCHDDITVTIVPENETYAQKMRRRSRMQDHPIGMDYNQVALSQGGKYHFGQFLDGGIRLFGGKVGCGSCHSLYSKSPMFLVATAKKGVLCKKCHNKGN